MADKIDPAFHVRKGIVQAKHEERQRLLQRPPKPEYEENETLLPSEPGIIQKLSDGASKIGTGFAIGGLVGLSFGMIYAFRKGTHPISTGLYTGLHIGLFGGLFTGFRDILPVGLKRVYWRFLASDEEKMLGEIDTSFLISVPGLDVPSFVSDMTERDWDLFYTGSSAASSGFIMNRLQAMEVAQKEKVSTGHLNSRGLRGAIFWGVSMTILHFVYQRFDDWRKDRIVETRLRQLYISNDEEKLKQLADGSETIPSREKVINYTWKELIDDPFLLVKQFQLGFSTLLPMVYSEEDAKYREYLESKYNLLETEVEYMERLQRKREKKIERLKKEIAELSQ